MVIILADEVLRIRERENPSFCPRLANAPADQRRELGSYSVGIRQAALFAKDFAPVDHCCF